MQRGPSVPKSPSFKAPAGPNNRPLNIQVATPTTQSMTLAWYRSVYIESHGRNRFVSIPFSR